MMTSGEVGVDADNFTGKSNKFFHPASLGEIGLFSVLICGEQRNAIGGR